MSIIEVGCRLEYRVHFETSFIFQVAVLDSKHQKVIKESLVCDPPHEIQVCKVGSLGHRIHRLMAEPGCLNLFYSATIDNKPKSVRSRNLISNSHSKLPCEVLEFLNPSRYCESDKLEQFAWDHFGKVKAGHTRVQAVADWVFNHLKYTPGSTSSQTTASDVFIRRVGVCRDFAHLTIALCRALGIPARYVAGYAVNLVPQDFHGLVEAYLDGAWYLFDATRLAPVNAFIRIGVGRDASDMSFSTYVGNSSLNHMYIWASDADGKLVPSGKTNKMAISLG
ncbi:transglutaminase-like domain-containing protein [Granulosicoccus antarcticus]|uniref:Transglutaminase-like domain-containing protein n=1 Tax=Granulosicoccus antarcticus IMCC3135 TaxID=1192854 RepID=A0A2Z2P187_9GAMM|nr:transglutaminase family protein [Granulosicoccus antarcticus]ASJ74167.1 hypothetical protein IMCC3135_20450 [Granulosicoccus antarcticus IMCC3135]